MIKLPSAFIEKYQSLLGERESTAFLTSLQQPAQNGFRLNPKKSPLPVRQDLQQNQDAIPWSMTGYYGHIAGQDIRQVSGTIYSQEPSAQAVAVLANPKPGAKVLDLCAAPGGKTTQLAALLDETGVLIANEIDQRRAHILSENVERFGYSNVIVTNETPQKLAEIWPHYFDVVVVDAPCSGEGMFRKDPQAISYWHSKYPQECQSRQRAILRAAMSMLAPQGNLVYSTCTFAPEEDEANVAWLLESGAFVVESSSTLEQTQISHGRPQWADNNEQLRQTYRFWPQNIPGEGHFIAKLHAVDKMPALAQGFQSSRKRPAKKKSHHLRPLNKKERVNWQTWIQSQLQIQPRWLQDKQIVVDRDQYYALPSELALPQLSAMRCLRRGLWLGTARKGRFIPNHALVMALPQQSWRQVIAIDHEQYQHFCHGETLTITADFSKDWYPVSFQGQIFSWGYLVGHTLKNFYPKNLRY